MAKRLARLVADAAKASTKMAIGAQDCTKAEGDQ
jgi:hypothetical protein